MWFRFWRPDYLYFRHSKLIDASDGSPFNRGWSQGFGLFVLDVRWNVNRSVSSDGIHYETKTRIWINGEQFLWPTARISYRQVIALAGQRFGATVIYEKAGSDEGPGTIWEGRSVRVKDGTRFTAVMTNSA